MPNYKSFDGRDKPSVKAKANKTEKVLAKKLGGFRQPASGAIEGMKGDVVTKSYLYDSKETKHMSISLSYDMLQKLILEAYDADKDPVLVLTYNEVKRGCKEFAVVPLNLWQEVSGETNE